MMTEKLVATTKIKDHILKEYDCFENGEWVDSICKVFHKSEKKHFAVYTSFNDAMAHKNEWMEDDSENS